MNEDRTVTTDIPVPGHDKKTNSLAAPTPGAPVEMPFEAPTLGVGGFYAEHRSLIDARKIHLQRVGIGPQPVATAGVTGVFALPTQATVLAMPTGQDETLLPPTNAPLVPEKAPASYATPKLPKLPGVNATLEE